MIRCIASLGLLLVALPAAAQVNVFKCTDAHGQVTYQGSACQSAQQQTTMQLDDAEPSTPAPALTSDEPKQPVVAMPQQPPRAPPDVMYQCVSAVDGKTYRSSNGNPAPYLAPLGVLGIVPTSMNDTYGAANIAHPSRPNGNMVGNNFTWVQDHCQPMPPDDTCRALRDDYDANELKLSRAFQSQQAPLLKREAELIDQLHHC